MKKHLTLLTAAAILATVAGTTMAANPSWNAQGGITTGAEYNFASHAWTTKIDSNNDYPYVYASISGNNGALTLGVTYQVNGSSNPALTVSGPIFGGSASLGSVSLGGDTWIDYYNGGNGVVFTKTVAPVSARLATAGNLNFVGGSVSLSPNTTLSAQAIANADFGGAAMGTLTYSASGLALSLKGAQEFGTAQDDSAVLGTMTYTIPNFVLSAKAWKYDAGYRPVTRPDGGDFSYDIPGTQDVTWKDDVNFFVRGDLVLKSVNGVEQSKGYASVLRRGAVDPTTVTLGASYKPLYITDANVSFVNNPAAPDTFTATATAVKSMFGATVTVTGGVQQTNGAPLAKAASIRVDKSYDWLSTWFSYGKGYSDPTATAKAGFSANVYIW